MESSVFPWTTYPRGAAREVWHALAMIPPLVAATTLAHTTCLSLSVRTTRSADHQRDRASNSKPRLMSATGRSSRDIGRAHVGATDMADMIRHCADTLSRAPGPNTRTSSVYGIFCDSMDNPSASCCQRGLACTGDDSSIGRYHDSRPQHLPPTKAPLPITIFCDGHLFLLPLLSSHTQSRMVRGSSSHDRHPQPSLQ
jgi:hypothetical protein